MDPGAAAYTQRFTQCPLCAAPAAAADLYKVASCSQHPLYKPGLPPEMRWLRCPACAHIYTENFWTEAGERVLFASALPHQLPDSAQSEHLRTLWAPTVRHAAERLAETRGRSAVFAARGAERPRWLDVGFGNGGLVMAADEFGFAASGVDVRAEAVAKLQSLGYAAVCAHFEQLSVPAPLSVLSMADALEHMVAPRAALRNAHALLDPDGLLYLSCPNSETSTWSLWEQAGTNPYWGELEHYHNFSRDRLIALLAQEKFDVIDYDVSVRYYSCMEVTARKRG